MPDPSRYLQKDIFWTYPKDAFQTPPQKTRTEHLQKTPSRHPPKDTFWTPPKRYLPEPPKDTFQNPQKIPTEHPKRHLTDIPKKASRYLQNYLHTYKSTLRESIHFYLEFRRMLFWWGKHGIWRVLVHGPGLETEMGMTSAQPFLPVSFLFSLGLQTLGWSYPQSGRIFPT